MSATITADKRMLIGVEHLERNVRPTVEVIERLGVKTVGLELPENYGYFSALYGPNYFTMVADAMHMRGVKVVSLDSSDLCTETASVMEKWKGLNQAAKIPTQELEEVERTTMEIDKVQREFFSLATKRSTHMVEVIKSRDVPIAVIGIGHLFEMGAQLPGYELLTLARP